MIFIKNLSYSYKDRLIFSHISAHIEKRTATAIIGPTGTGKSVLLKIIAGLIPSDANQIKVNTDRISMLFQKNALFDSHTVLQNLLIPLHESSKIMGDEALNRAHSMLDAVGLSSAANRYPGELSGGMQKRVGIARALIVEPELILYDEPTAGLDPITSKTISELIVELHRKTKSTLVMVSNDLNRVFQIADNLYFCNNQTLLKVGTPDEAKSLKSGEIRDFIYANSLSKLKGRI